MVMPTFLPLILFPFLLATMFCFHLTAAGARAELDDKAPDYARQLYRSTREQLLHRLSPVNGFVLFFRPVPDAVKGSVAALRLLMVLHFALLAGFFACMVF